MKILIAGFDPFGGETINPAYEAVKRLDDEIEGCLIIKKELPTVFAKSIKMLEKTIEETNPDIVICIGQAGGRTKISIERIAININDASIADNDGNQPIDDAIYNNGHDGYFTNLPIKRMMRFMNEKNIPTEISNTAGSYVCNHLMYGLMYLINNKYKNIRGGFIHVPYIHEQVINKNNLPSMNLDDIVLGLKYAIIAAIDLKEDEKLIGGKIF